MTMVLYAFREREDLMDAYEAVSGARMHAAYYRPGGVYRDLPDRMPQYVGTSWKMPRRRQACSTNRKVRCSISSRTSPTASRPTVDEYETLLTDNRIWQRTVGHRRHRHAGARWRWGFTGPMLRGSGIAWDLRKKQPYEVYDRSISTSRSASTATRYDRYLVRMEEMRQSNRIIKQCIDWLRKNPGPVITDNHKVAPPSREP